MFVEYDVSVSWTSKFLTFFLYLTLNKKLLKKGICQSEKLFPNTNFDCFLLFFIIRTDKFIDVIVDSRASFIGWVCGMVSRKQIHVQLNHSKPVSFITNAVPLETEAVSSNHHSNISRKVVYSKILGIECEKIVKVKVDTSCWVMVTYFSAKRSEVLLKLHTHTECAIICIVMCIIWKKSLMFIDYVKYRTCIIHTCICLLCK